VETTADADVAVPKALATFAAESRWSLT